ncbi:hypothetical protein EZV62_006474 [Acer yangbiense]|uniref:Wall-associated receptor kinase galacturonan-binding domain-containing protein n=1 Tax=Acer yangbiense TaxID=1000413 RepID=A0A5C7I8Y7_9ROSI|nr:hypothetical protein EZV62_006474 [Acer yangbiense]
MVLVIFFILTLVTYTYVSAHDACPKCGSMEVPCPLSTNDNCGDPRYRVLCNNDILQFESAVGFHYKIIRGLKLDDNSPFNISTHNTVMLFNCTENILLSPLNCSSNSFCRHYEEKVKEGNGCRGTLCCHFLKDSAMTAHRIRVRVGGCTAYTSVVDLKSGDDIDSWNYGIELQWMPPNYV